MSGPNGINGSKSSNQIDPYNNPDDWLNQDLYSDPSYSDQGALPEDQYVGMDGGNGDTSSPLSVTDTLQTLKETANQLRSQIHDANTDPAQKKQLIQVLQKTTDLISKLTALKNQHKEEVPANLEQQINDVELAANPTGTDGTDASGVTDGSGDPTAQQSTDAIKKDLTDFKTSINSNPNLTADKKSQYTQKIDQWLNGLDLKTIDAETIQPLLDSMKQEVTTASAYAPSIQSLAQATGKSPEELDALFKKHNLDPKNLPNPPDASVAALLNDPELGDENINSDKQAVKDSLQALKDEIDNKTKAASDLNSANVASDTSVQDNLDVSSFKFLYDASQHNDDKSKALSDARKKLATDTATILSAMYGKTVTASTDPKKSGFISFDGTDLNVCTSSTSGDVQFGTSDVDWPTVSLPTYDIDAEGDGVTPVPQWMKDASYPVHVYDNGSGDEYDSTANKM